MNLVVDTTYWIDVCQSNGNLLASGGDDKVIKIFDKRESKVVKTFEGMHSSKEFPSVLVVIRYLGFVYSLICFNFSSHLPFQSSL